jgi:hypothetical protein
MKIQHLIHSKKRGSVLLITLLVCASLFVFMASYLYLIQAQSLAVSRSQAWNYAIVVAESGVEEGMAHLNSGVGVNNLGTNGWISLKNSSYLKTNQLGTSYSVVTIIATNTAVPVILATAYVPGPIGTPNLTRTVQVTATPSTGLIPPGAMVVNTTVTFSGGGVSTDSYNSTNLVLFPGGRYNIANRQDKGDLVTLSDAGSINIQNGSVRGRLHAASGVVGDVQINGGTVGSNGWFNAGNTGIEPGGFTNDVNYTFKDATLPDFGGKIPLTPVVANGGKGQKIGSVTYSYVLNNSNPWKIATLDGGVFVNETGVVLWVTSGIALGPNDRITITTNASTHISGSLAMYVTATDATVGGDGIVNETGLAKNFQYYGLPQNATLSFGANASFIGIIYAPSVVFTLGGGGNNTTNDFCGQCVTKSTSMNGHFNFHYDEGISLNNGGGVFNVISWDEL